MDGGSPLGVTVPNWWCVQGVQVDVGETLHSLAEQRHVVVALQWFYWPFSLSFCLFPAIKTHKKLTRTVC